MASGKRASMREGPLAQLFRKTDEEEPATDAPVEERAEPRAAARPPAGSAGVPAGPSRARASGAAPARAGAAA